MRSVNHSWYAARSFMAIAVILGTAVCACAVTEKVIYSFGDSSNSAIYPNAVVFDAAGNLYGTSGGGSGICSLLNSCGVIFELSPTPLGWTESVLHDFSGLDGADPIGSLILDAAGNLYGTTKFGGGSGCGGAGCGVVFELSPTSSGWNETVLYTFTGGTDGGEPDAGLTSDGRGHLYGTAALGGGSSKCSSGCGTVFQLARKANAWSLKVLHSFTGGSDGAEPIATLAIDSSGSLYGTAADGGKTSCAGLTNPGCGTAFTVTPAAGGGWKFGILHSFSGGSDGSNPVGGVILDRARNVYGTTLGGGAANNGTVFRLGPGSAGWKETILYTFAAANDGALPTKSLILDQAGNLYGTTQSGIGDDIYGTAFELTPKPKGSWTETVLHAFAGGLDGQTPASGLIFDTAGNLYGSTAEGGSISNAGTVFEITP
jgi:uncharacterized repeat protein (TIGR03803 family)